MIGAGEADLFRVATRAGLGDEKARLAKKPGLRVALVFHLRAGDPVESAAQHDVAVAMDRLVFERIRQLVGQHRFASRPQFDIAFRRHTPLGAFEAVGAQEQRPAHPRITAELHRCRLACGRRHQRSDSHRLGCDDVDVARQLQRQRIGRHGGRGQHAVQGGPCDERAGGKLHRVRGTAERVC